MQPGYSIWKIAVLLPIFFFVPGALILAYVRGRYHSDLPRSEAAVISVAVSVGLTSFAGLMLAQAGIYSLTSLAVTDLAIASLVAGGIYLRRKSARRYPSGAPGWWWVGLLAVATLASVFYVGGFEAILTERDASPYVAEAVNMADRGTVPLENKELAELTAEEASVFYGTGGNLAGTREYNSGFRIEDLEKGQVNTRYFPVYSVTLAVGYRMFGMRGALTLVNAFLAVLAVLVLMVLARRLFGTAAAMATGLILAVNPLMIWFARYPIPEVFTILFVFLGIFAFTFFYPRGNGYWGALSAFGFATAVGAHFDMYALVPIVAALLFVVFTRMVIMRERAGYLLWFIGPFLVLSTVYIAGHVHYTGPYISAVSGYVPSYVRNNLSLILPAAAALAVLFPYALRFVLERGLFRRAVSFARANWRVALVIIVVAVALFAYLVLPYTGAGKKNVDPRVSEGRAKMLNRLAWYFTHLGMALALLGMALYVVMVLDRRSMPLFLVAWPFSFLLVFRPWCNPLHMWSYRRFIPMLIPLAAMFMGYALAKLPGLLKRGLPRRIGTAVSAAALLAMLFFTVPYSLSVRGVVQYQGVLASNQELAQRLSGDRVAAVFYGPLARAYYPETLRFMYGTNAFPYRDPTNSTAAFDAACEKLRSLGKDVYLIGLVDGLPRAAANQVAVPIGAQRVSFTFFADQYDKRPSKTRRFMYDLRFYLLEGPAPGEKRSVDIVAGEAEVLLNGFYDVEEAQGERYRWTGGTSEFRVPLPEGGDTLTLLLTARAPSLPGASPPVPVEVYADGVPAGLINVSSDWVGLYPVTFSRSLLRDPDASSAVIRVSAPVFSPMEAGVSSDPRQLGLQIHGINIRSDPG